MDDPTQTVDSYKLRISILRVGIRLRTEAEQLLYYSIPGFFIFFFAFLFLISIDKFSIFSIDWVPFILAAVIPVGFIVYQTYVLTLYKTIWYGRFFYVSDPCKEFFKSHIDGALKPFCCPELLKDIEKSKDISWLHLHTYQLHQKGKPETIDYSWRLINLINARGVAAFTCIMALMIPVVYVAYYYVHAIYFSLPLPALPNIDGIAMGVLYIVSIITFTAILLSGISRIKKHLSDFNLGNALSETGELKEFILAYAATKVACKVKEAALKKKNLEAINLMESAFGAAKEKEVGRST